MSTLAVTALTLIDLAKRMDPNDKIARIIELLAQKNEILQEMTWKEGNLITGELTSVRTGLPAVYWRLINAGVQPSKSHTTQITEQCGMLEAYSQVDQALAELGGDVNGVRFSEAQPFLEAMNQEMAQTLFYGTAAAPEEFIGLSARYSALSGAGNSDNVVTGGGSSTLTSMWLISWGQETITGIFPKGSTAGLKHEDLGLETIENAGGVSGALMRGYRDHFIWKAGIAVKDWRYAVRVPNIDTSALASGGADLLALMADAEERLPDNAGNRAWYVNRTIRRYLRKQERAGVTTGGGLTFENIAGRRVLHFGETPIRRTDALLNSESVVS